MLRNLWNFLSYLGLKGTKPETHSTRFYIPSSTNTARRRETHKGQKLTEKPCSPETAPADCSGFSWNRKVCWTLSRARPEKGAVTGAGCATSCPLEVRRKVPSDGWHRGPKDWAVSFRLSLGTAAWRRGDLPCSETEFTALGKAGTRVHLSLS